MEFDKLFISGNNNEAPSDVTIGVQNEFLDLLENSEANVIGLYGHYNKVSLKNTLFIFAGAFNGQEINEPNDLLNFNVKREFIGRIPLYCRLEEMDINTMLELVDKSRLLREYLKITPNRKNEIDIIKDKIRNAFDSNFLGARLINNTIHRHFLLDDEEEHTEELW